MRYTEEQITQAVNDYISGLSTFQVSAKYGMCHSVVSSFLKRRGVKARGNREARRNLCSIDQDYFETIDSHDKAQILGFIFADGCVVERTNHGKTLQIILNSKDSAYLENIQNRIKNTRELKWRTYHGKDGITRNTVSFVTSNPKIISDLSKYGVLPRKSLTIGFPPRCLIPKEFIGSFIRGAFEGDGCIYINKNGKRNQRCADVSLAATTNFNEEMAKILKEEYEINSFRSFPSKMSGKNFCVFRIGTIPDIMKFYDLIYANYSFVMDRKRDKFLEFKNGYDENMNFKFNLRSTNVCGIVKSPDGNIYSFNTVKDFIDEMGLGDRFYPFANKKKATYKKWTHASQEEIAAAQASGQIIEKIYRQPL